MSEPIHVAASRTYPVALDDAYDRTVVVDLDQVMSRRHLVLPPVREVRDQTDGTWGSTLGATRTIVTADGGTMREQLTAVERPDRFAYELTRLTGPLKPLVARIEGEWRFEPAGTGTRVTWSWNLYPTSRVAAPVVGVVMRLWPRFARQALEELESALVV